MTEDTRPDAAKRLEQARIARGFKNARQAADYFGWRYVTYTQHESGQRGIVRAANQYAKAFRVSEAWLLTGEGKGPDGEELSLEVDAALSRSKPRPNASFPPRYQEFPQDHSIPLLGQTAGGPNGRFILNGTEVGRVFCPPMLEGVEGAYAVMVYGTSMEPRYFAGETVWVNPHLPVRAGDDVIAQLIDDGEDAPVESYIKRFESRSSRVLRLYQYNPDEGEEHELEFDAADVFSVHKIVFKANP
ncbi:repressor protein C [Falsochrobactrum shanghaiense]|uniref:Repressor protein C n=1 Tax=Falsochrobactrum shanghaiense TaxID=2201899 RepID=A0A316J9H8_9HYPH|nr:S24 family peptidase [Falsochrobactrum shanghaiense]PWL17419.1 repressor protein C [Falsochrobactrum shanghaiense]